MDNKDVKMELILNGIISPEEKLNVRFKKKIEKRNDLIFLIKEITSYLEYDATIRERIQCIIQEITHQPKCSFCGKVLKMRLSGKYVNTFPKTCGSKCFSKDIRVKEKRKKTNLKKYGSKNYLASERGKLTTRNTLIEKYNVTNPAFIKGNFEKRLQTQPEKTKIVQITKKEGAVFFENTHVQGHIVANIYYGLVFNNILIACMSFKKIKKQWKVIQYSTSLNADVVNGDSKLLKHFLKIKKPKLDIFYSGKNWQD